MNKTDFSESLEFERAKAAVLYRGERPIPAKVASMCLKDAVDLLGANSSGTLGSCELSEACNYSNDKVLGAGGACLKATVGVESEV
jgi:hypothetical protein